MSRSVSVSLVFSTMKVQSILTELMHRLQTQPINVPVLSTNIRGMND